MDGPLYGVRGPDRVRDGGSDAVGLSPQAARQLLFRQDGAHVVAAFRLASRCFELFLWGCGLSVWAVNIAKSVAWKK